DEVDSRARGPIQSATGLSRYVMRSQRLYLCQMVMHDQDLEYRLGPRPEIFGDRDLFINADQTPLYRAPVRRIDSKHGYPVRFKFRERLICDVRPEPLQR